MGRKESWSSGENGMSSRGESPTSMGDMMLMGSNGGGNGKESLKLLISRASATGEVKCSPSTSPKGQGPAPIKLKFMKKTLPTGQRRMR